MFLDILKKYCTIILITRVITILQSISMRTLSKQLIIVVLQKNKSISCLIILYYRALNSKILLRNRLVKLSMSLLRKLTRKQYTCALYCCNCMQFLVFRFSYMRTIKKQLSQSLIQNIIVVQSISTFVIIKFARQLNQILSI